MSQALGNQTNRLLLLLGLFYSPTKKCIISCNNKYYKGNKWSNIRNADGRGGGMGRGNLFEQAVKKVSLKG